MYGKIFTSILDSSVAKNIETRVTFMDMIILCDQYGVVDMDHEAIAIRTRRPIEVIRSTVAELEGPDPGSRTPDFGGARIKRLDDHRDWGWRIVNHAKYRDMGCKDKQREQTKERTRKWREGKDLKSGDASVTHGDGCDAIQIQIQKQIQKEESGDLPGTGRIATQAAQIYDQYPHRVGRPAALKSIEFQLKITDFDTLMSATKEYARLRPKGTPFTPNPTTWFSQQRYNDDPSTWAPRSASSVKSKPKTCL